MKVSRRLQIEITSDKGDGTFTWRAAGAREPKGLIAADLLPQGKGVTSVITAEVEQFMDGMEVVTVIQQEDTRQAPETIELIGSKQFTAVTQGGKPAIKQKPASKVAKGAPSRQQPRKPKINLLRLGSQHRNAWLKALPEEHKKVGDEIFAASKRVRSQEPKSKTETQDAPDTQPEQKPSKSLRDQLFAEFKVAEWKDRAAAADANFPKVDLADLRMLVADALEYELPPEAETQAQDIRKRLEERIEREHTEWLAELATSLNEDKLLRALRLSGNPPKTGVPLPDELVKRLTEATQEFLSEDTPPDRWQITLEVLAFSPVRRLVTPKSLPQAISPELSASVTELKDRLPHIAEMFATEKESSKKIA